jgi:hypothetical protein
MSSFLNVILQKALILSSRARKDNAKKKHLLAYARIELAG